MDTAREMFESAFGAATLVTEKGPQERLSRLERLFSKLVKEIDFVDMAKHLTWEQKYGSHVKTCLFKTEHNNDTLKLELLRFENQIPTPLHTHPEILIEEVLTGALQEEVYALEEEGPRLVRSGLRPKGHRRSLYDLNGHPHVVRALSQTSLNLCLSYGTSSPQIRLKEIL